MKVDVTLSKAEVEEAIKSYLEDAGYDLENANIDFKVSSGGSARDPREPTGPRFRKVKINDVET